MDWKFCPLNLKSCNTKNGALLVNPAPSSFWSVEGMSSWRCPCRLFSSARAFLFCSAFPPGVKDKPLSRSAVMPLMAEPSSLGLRSGYG